MGHFFSIVYNGMAAARFHGNGFRHTDGGRVFGTDAAIDLLQAQFLESVPQASSGGFRGIAVVPIRIVQDVAEFHRFIPVYHAFHQPGLSDKFAPVFQHKGEIPVAVLAVTGELAVHPLAHLLLVKAVFPCVHDFRLAHEGEQRARVLAGDFADDDVFGTASSLSSFVITGSCENIPEKFLYSTETLTTFSINQCGDIGKRAFNDCKD